MSEPASPSLEQLVDEERKVSLRRSRLHDRIDFLRGTGMTEPDAESRLATLLAEEREVSVRRHELHALIDSARAERGNAEGEAPGRERPLEG
jgi:hypothetical protein